MKNHAKQQQQDGPKPDPRELVISALEDDRYDWRSLDGIARQTDLERAQIRRIIGDLGALVVRSSIPDEEGRALYTTRSHYNSTHSIGARLLNALADKVA